MRQMEPRCLHMIHEAKLTGHVFPDQMVLWVDVVVLSVPQTSAGMRCEF